MKVLTYNINGLRSATGKGLFPWLARQDADVICFQEVRAQEHQLPPLLIELPGYRAYWLTAAKRKGYSGVALLLKKPPDRIVTGLGISELDDEGRLIRADYGNLSIASLYVPSGISGADRQAHKLVFLNKLLSHLIELREAGREIILCGDFNIAHREIDLARPERNQRTSGFLPDERKWMDSFLGSGFIDVYRKVIGDEPGHYSFWTAWDRKLNRGWRLDYQIATPSTAAKAKTARIFSEELYSDHAPVLIDYEL